MTKGKMPEKLYNSLKSYLDQDEKMIDILRETFVPHFDFRWLVLTNKSVIIAIRELFNYKFVDFHLRNIDINLEYGFLYDQLEFGSMGKNYRAQFYVFQRGKTLDFFKKMKEQAKIISEGKEKKKPPSDPIELIKELTKLLKRGIITKQEFEKKKEELLKKIK
ncbi:MAG: hypothetical protein M1355_01415 [Patescibacteria group bacterium]|nr:hypothetical protein [Patescibacteria group bacterium]